MTILADIGEGITVVNYTYSTSSDYGDKTKTGSTVHSVTGRVNILSSDAQEVKSGHLQTGDAIGYFDDSDFSKMNSESIIEYQNVQFRASGAPRKYSLGGAAHHVEVDLKRESKP